MSREHNGEKADLLVVDDNRVNRLLVARTLEQLGHRVAFAENGRQALEALPHVPSRLRRGVERDSPGRQRADQAVGAACPALVDEDQVPRRVDLRQRARHRPRRGDLYHLLRCALLNNGVDCASHHGWISAVHSDADIERSIAAHEKAFRAMAADGAFKGM